MPLPENLANLVEIISGKLAVIHRNHFHELIMTQCVWQSRIFLLFVLGSQLRTYVTEFWLSQLLPLKRAYCWSPTYLVYHEKGDEVLKRLNDQVPQLEWHEGTNRSKIFLNVMRGVIVTLGSKMDPLLLLWDEKLGTGGDPPVKTGGHPSKKCFWAWRSLIRHSPLSVTRQMAHFPAKQLSKSVFSYPWPSHLPTPLSWEESSKIWIERLLFH